MKVPILIPNIFNHPFTYNSDLKLKGWRLCSSTHLESQKLLELYGMILKKKQTKILQLKKF